MNTKMTKVELMEELKTAYQRIAELEAIVVNFRDSTERVADQEQLHESEEKYRVLINSTSDGVFVAQDERFIFYNEALPIMLGYTFEEFIDMPFEKVTAPEHLNLWTSRFRQRIAGQNVVSNYQVQFMDKTGTKKIWIELRANLINYGGQPAVLGIVRDITEQKNILEQIESLAKFPAENPGPILRIDLSGKLIYTNDACFAYLTEWSLVVGKQAPDVVLKVAAIVLETGRDKTIETIHKDRVISLDFILLKQSGYINVYGRDITEQRRAEENLRALQQFSQSTLDALSSTLCVLDETGVILSVNAPWRAFADANPPVPLNYGVGENYLAICDNAQGEETGEAHEVAAGLRAVLNGESGEYHLEYPCHSPEEQRWYLLRARRFESYGVPRLVISHENVTERKQMESERAQLTERLNLATYAARLGIWDWDVQKKQLVWDDQMYALYGLKPGEFGGAYEAWLNGVHPEDREASDHAVTQAMRGEHKFDNEFRVMWPDGSVHWLKANGDVFRDENGSPLRMVGVNYDITESKRAEAGLAEAQRVAKLGNWHYDIPSNRVTWSDEMYRIFDVDKTKFGGMNESFLSHVHPDDRERVAAVNQYAQTSGEAFNVEYRIVTRAAVEKYIHESGYALRDAAGQVTSLFGIAQDVTEQVEAEARIRESEKRFQQIAETIPEMFWIFDHAQQSLVYTSPAYEDIWGYTVKNLYEGSRLYIEAVHPDDRGIVSAVLERQARGEATETQYRIVQFNGSVRWIHDRSFPVFDEENGVVLRTIGIAADITERRQVGEALRDNEERLRLSLNAAKQGLYDLNPQTGNVIVNREYAEMLGYDLETFVETYQNWLERLHPDDAEITSQTYANYISGRIPEYRVEFRLRTRDGKWKWILSLGKIVEYDADGKPTRMLGTHTDITENKQAELELQKRASHLALINAVGSQIAGFLDFQAAMDIFPRLISEAFGYHHIGLFTLDKGSNALVMCSKAGEYAGHFPPGHRIQQGEGIVGSVGMSGEMKLVNQVYDDPLYIPTLIPTQSELSLPIRVAGEVVGVLDVQSPQPNAFTDEDIKVLGTLVDQMAVVIENARLYEAVQKELTERKRLEGERQALIYDLGERVKELTVLHQAARLFQNTVFSESETLQALVEIMPPAWQYSDVTVARITVDDKEYKTPGFIETPWMQKTVVNLPGDRNAVIEVAYLEERPAKDHGPFSQEEQQLIEMLAEKMQAALTRHSMERDLRKRTEDLSNLLKAGRALSETLEPERIYPLVYRYIADAMPCDSLVLSAFDPQTELITCEYLHSQAGPQDVSGFPPIPLEPPGRGTQSLVIRSGESLLLPDYDSAVITAANRMQFNEKAEILEENLEDPQRTRSAIIVPLKVNGVVAGALQVFSFHLNAHTPDHLHFVEALAFHVSAALSNAKLFSELEERVQQRTAEVRDLYENAPTGYHSLNGEGRFVNVNQTELNWLGYTRAEVIGRPFTDFLTPETIHVFVEAFPVFKQQGWVNNLEFDLLRKDGTSFPVLLSATAVKNETGDFLMSRSTVFDNTERKETELALHEREDIYRALFQSANDSIFMLSPDGIILQANPSCLELLGYTTADEIIGKMSVALIADSDQDDAENTVKRLLAGEHLPVSERIFVRKNGALIETEVNLSLIRDEFGDPKFIQSVVRDISVRKQAENALRESEEQNRLLFEESPDAVVLFDPNGRVVRINRAFGSITGRDDKQFIGHFVMELGILPRELMTALLASTEEAFEQDSKFALLEFKLKHTSGELRDINARVFTLKLHGEPHYLASMHDITTSKRAEEALRFANAEMERALRLKDEFLANMSHELRTPLNAILGISESLLEQISGPLNKKQQKYLQTVLESAQHLLELINDILDLAKINAGRVDLDVNKVDIDSLAQTSLRMVRELAQKKGVDAALEIDKTIKLAWVDERRLKQMLINLLSNAVKFTPKGGRIGLKVRGDVPAGILHFTIWDTGIGISEKDLRLLFQPFMQLDAGLARGSQGTGLGLVLVSQMARLHGGSISVESEPGKGSHFTISLPWVVAGGSDSLVRRDHPSISQDTSAIRTKDGNPIILIVEDTVAVTMLISDYLTQHGYQVIVARDGYEGIARSAETRPDLILMDVMMPELDGLETTRRIRKKPELANVPIIALTALAMAGDRESCMAAGMNDYLSKPVKLKELLDTIERHLAIHSGGTK